VSCAHNPIQITKQSRFHKEGRKAGTDFSLFLLSCLPHETCSEFICNALRTPNFFRVFAVRAFVIRFLALDLPCDARISWDINAASCVRGSAITPQEALSSYADLSLAKKDDLNKNGKV
jgi:hypothetical protein